LKSTVILTKPFGDHSNRLFQAIHYEAFCLERGHRFYNLSFSDMRPIYAKNRRKSDLKKQTLINRLLKNEAVNRVVTKLTQTPATPEALEAATRNPLVCVGGWDFRVPELTKKYQDFFCSKYALNPKFLSGVQLCEHIKTWKKQGASVVGLHIRRGDYKEWKDGRYFFSDAVYAQHASHLAGLLAEEGKKCKTIVFSNEAVSIHRLINCEVSCNNWFVDQYLMSCCDYILGPPSTFSLWASYIGKTKYLHLNEKTDPFRLSDFSYNFH
jgi:hypothetical protein